MIAKPRKCHFHCLPSYWLKETDLILRLSSWHIASYHDESKLRIYWAVTNQIWASRFVQWYCLWPKKINVRHQTLSQTLRSRPDLGTRLMIAHSILICGQQWITLILTSNGKKKKQVSLKRFLRNQANVGMADDCTGWQSSNKKLSLADKVHRQGVCGVNIAQHGYIWHTTIPT